MSKQVFISLPVTDVARSTAFYEAIGFTKNEAFSNDHASALVWSDGFSLMVAAHDFYSTLTPKRIADPKETSQALFALALDSREAVDAMSAAAVSAGGHEAHGAQDEGFLYSRGFEDPDGHGWGPFFMDASAAPAA